MSESVTAWVDADEVRRLAAALMPSRRQEIGQAEVDYGADFEGFVDAEGAGEAVSEPVASASPFQVAPEQQEESTVQAASFHVPKQSRAEVSQGAAEALKRAREAGLSGGVLKGEEAAVAMESPFRKASEVRTLPSAEVLPVVEPRVARPEAPSGELPILARVQRFGDWLKREVGVQGYFVSNLEGQLMIDEVQNAKLVETACNLAGSSALPRGASDSSFGSLHVRIGEATTLEVVPTPSQFGILVLGLIVPTALEDDVVHEVSLGLKEAADARLVRKTGALGANSL
ncbi:MAG: hypothetical protein AAGC74_06930 [Verrucomicrobiota bacterium]